MDDCGSTCPYYSLDSCCTIQDILELVVETSRNRCSTLPLVNVMSGINCFTDKNEKEKQPVKTSKPRTWKLKWYSQETMLKFIAILKAIHLGLTASPLPVKCCIP